MAGLFDDVPDAAPAATPNAAKGQPSLFDDVPDAKPSALARAGEVAADVANSAGAGLIRGAAGLVDLPQTLYGLADQGVGVVARGLGRAVGLTPNSDLGADTRPHGLIPSPADLPKPGGTAIHALEAVTEPLYKPKTTAGEYAGTIAEFVPGAGATKALEAGALAGAKTLAKTVAAPAIASETAGQVTKGTDLEPWARGVAGVGAGLGVAAAARPGVAERAFEHSAGKISPEEVGQVQSLVSDAKARGIDLTWPEALQQVVGPRRMGDLLRVVEGQGKLQDFFAARPGQIRAAGEAGLDTIAPAASPGQVGDAAQAAARNAVAATPEGQAVIRASQAAGPRVTADQAGQVIQREMRAVQDAREARRTEQAGRDYEAARDAPERIGVDRTVTVERPGEPVLQTLDVVPSRGPEFQAPPDGPATIGSLAPKRPDAPQNAGSRGPSLARFISENGGIGLERGDVKAAGLDRVRQPGVANLVRQDGKSIDDFWRERLIEEGYLPPDRDGGMARNIHDELISRLEEEAKGRKTYPYDYLGRDDLNGFGAMKDEFADSAGRAMTDVREALKSVDVDPHTVHKDILDRAAAALMRGDETDPLKAYERTVMASREPAAQPSSRLIPTTVTEEISAPRFGQANPQPAIDALDRQVRTAKGDVRASLEGIRRDLYEHGVDPTSGVRETDLSVEGLLHARERLDQHIEAARDVGDRTKMRDLQIVRASLDRQLKAVPEVATADANFVANSRPLDAFAGDAPLGRVTARNEQTGRMSTPAEQVPSNLQGATAAREFLRDATPEARRAFQDREVTRILDEVSSGEGASADRIRAAMRRNEDLLSQLPEARGRLQRLANAYQGREAVERSPLGRIANRPDVKNAMDALFPAKLVEGSSREVGDAVAGMVRSNAVAARQLVRTYLATEFAASKPASQTGGAKFAARLTDNPLRSENVSAAIRALPNGEALDRGFSRLIEIMQATGQRQGIGSRTSFNNEALAELRTGGPAAEAGQALATGGLKLPGRIVDALQTWRLGKNLDRLAELMTTAEGGRRLAQLADAKTSASTIALLNTITRSVAHGAERARDAADDPLRLTVRPSQ